MKYLLIDSNDVVVSKFGANVEIERVQNDNPQFTVIVEPENTPDPVLGMTYKNGAFSGMPINTNHEQPQEKRVSPVEFKLLFTSQERVAVKTIRTTDPVVDDFYDILEDPRLTIVDLGLESTIQGVTYMFSLLKVALSYSQEETDLRVAEVLSGKFK